MNTIIKTPQQLSDAITNAWIFGFIVVGFAILIAFIIALIINWRPDRRDYITRRFWFILIGIIFTIGYWLYNLESIVPTIQNVGFKNKFESNNYWILTVTIITYFVVGIITMFVCKRGSKWRSVLPKKFQ